jgi:Flp pilus assembly protein TadD
MRRLLEQRRFEEALHELQLAALERPKDLNLLLDVAAAAGQAGNFAVAADALERALQLAPDNAATHSNLGIVRAQRGDRSGAIEAFKRAVELDPANATQQPPPTVV